MDGESILRRRIRKLIFLAKRGIVYLILVTSSVVALFPLYWIFVTAFKSPTVVLSMPPSLIPNPPTLLNFQRLFLQSMILRWTANTVLVAGLATTATVFFGTLAGYTIAKKDFPGKNIIFISVISMLMVPGQLTLIPLYTMITRLGWRDTFYALIVPGLISPFAIFLMKQYLQTLPIELFDAGKIDGCSEVGLFLRIALPLAKPGMAVVGIFTFMAHWNDFLWPLIVTSKDTMRTLQIGLSSLQFRFSTDYGLLMAGATYAAIPMIIFFLLFQRWFVQGITIGALKG